VRLRRRTYAPTKVVAAETESHRGRLSVSTGAAVAQLVFRLFARRCYSALFLRTPGILSFLHRPESPTRVRPEAARTSTSQDHLSSIESLSPTIDAGASEPSSSLAWPWSALVTFTRAS
jgi:hypothetical protein